MTLSQPEAAKLDQEIRVGLVGLVNLSQAIERFIEGEGWIGLGHKTFTAWCKVTMTDAPAASILKLIAYQMLDEGASALDLAKNIKGLGIDTAEFLARQHDEKKPIELVSSYKPRQPKTGSYISTLFLRMPTAELRRWRQLAVDLESTVEDLAHPVLKGYFDDLATELGWEDEEGQAAS